MAEGIEIDFVDILEIIGDFIRPLVEEQAILNAKHIITCEILSKNEKSAVIQALCLQTSDLIGLPHQVEVKIDLDNNVKTIICHCTCKAGNSGKCKHIIGTLLYIFRHTVEDLEELASTEIKQQWGKLKKERKIYETMVPISKFCHMKSKNTTSKELDNHLANISDVDVLNILLSTAENSELSLTLKNDSVSSSHTMCYEEEMLQLSLCHSIIGNNQVLPHFADAYTAEILLQSDVAQFYKNNVVVSYNDSIQLCLTTVHQTGDVWKNLRRVRITGTTCYNLFTYGKNKNPNWLNMINQLYNSNFKGNSATFHGKKYEAKALEVYEQQTGNKVEHLGIVIPVDVPWLAVSLDGIVSGKCCVEVKCLLAGKNQSINSVTCNLKYLCIEEENNNITLKKNHVYYGQVQLQMLLSGLQKCHFVIFCSHDDTYCIIDIPFDSLFINKMLKVLIQVYFTHVLPTLVQLNK